MCLCFPRYFCRIYGFIGPVLPYFVVPSVVIRGISPVLYCRLYVLHLTSVSVLDFSPFLQSSLLVSVLLYCWFFPIIVALVFCSLLSFFRPLLGALVPVFVLYLALYSPFLSSCILVPARTLFLDFVFFVVIALYLVFLS